MTFPQPHFLFKNKDGFKLTRYEKHPRDNKCCVNVVNNELRMCQTYFVVPDLPDGKPRITGVKEKYQIGEQLEAMCTSWQSHPAANLTWFINEEPVSASKANQLWREEAVSGFVHQLSF